MYEELSELDFADHVVPGLRRKLDVYRKVLDDWRVLLIDVESRVKLERACRGAAGAFGRSLISEERDSAVKEV